MEAPRRTVIAVLSADAECIGRLRRLCGEWESLVLVTADDPDELLLGVIASLSQSEAHASSKLAGVLIDLTAPRPCAAQGDQRSRWEADEDTADLAAATKIALGVSNLLSVLKIGSAPPLIVVSTNSRLPAHLDASGIPLRGFLSPTDDDATWRQALEILLAEQRQAKRISPPRSEHKLQRIIQPPTAVPLRDDLWFDPAACELLRPRKRIPLTARGSSLLAILLRTPRTYLPASELAQRLTPPGGYPIDAHSLQQSVSALRHKLGESKGEPHLLLVRRGVGYGIFPQISHVTQASTAAATLATAVEFSHRRHRET